MQKETEKNRRRKKAEETQMKTLHGQKQASKQERPIKTND
jgi:hypothetical protein